MRLFYSSLLVLAVVGCNGALSDAPPACDPNACLSTKVAIVGAYYEETFFSCASFQSYEYNKGSGRGFSCDAPIPACGDASVDALNRALADPEVVAALAKGSTEFSDSTLPDGEMKQFYIYDPSTDAAHHSIYVGSQCPYATCPPAPPGVVRLAHLLLVLEKLCVPHETQ